MNRLEKIFKLMEDVSKGCADLALKIVEDDKENLKKLLELKEYVQTSSKQSGNGSKTTN